MELTTEQALQQGVTAHQEGKLQDAERLYRAILQSQPAHPDANHNLGLIAVSVNKTDAALPLFKTALEANPKIEQFWLSYIDALIKEKHFDNAKKVIQQGKQKGVDKEKLNKLDKKIGSIKKQKNIDSTSPSQAQINTLSEHYQNGRLGAAENLSMSITQQFPAHQFGWKVLGAVLKQTGRTTDSLTPMQKSVQLAPQDAEAHNNLGVTLKELGRLDEALASNSQAIALRPDYAEAHYNLGVTLQELGRLDESEASCRQAIALKPDFAKAHHHLALMKKFDVQDEQYSQMLELYFDENISDEKRCHINFSLAKACEDLKDFKQAFVHYSEGNELRKKLLNYDINQDVELFKQLKSSYPKIEKNSLEPDKLSKNLMPIFIVGMPRSGTTLVEQIISSHSQVTGAGELNFAAQFGAAIATGFTEANNESLLDFRHNYLNKLQNVSNGNLIVTDKMPQNFRYIGLLAAAFPEAKIVHVKRNPAAVCWANYKQYFESRKLSYCYEIEDVVSYHRLYKNLMEFWGNSLSKRIYNLDYELLTINQENETRQLIDCLGLDWDEKCLSPQNNARIVKTASSLQVRKKVYRGSSEQWKKYEPFLNGALDGLLLP